MKTTAGCNGISSVQKSVQESKDLTFLNFIIHKNSIAEKNVRYVSEYKI